MVVNWWLNKDILQHEPIIINKHDYVTQSFCLELRIRKILRNLGVKYCVTKPLKCFAIQSNKSPWYLRLSYSMSICRDQNLLMTKRDQLTFALPRRYVKTLRNYEKTSYTTWELLCQALIWPAVQYHWRKLGNYMTLGLHTNSTYRDSIRSYYFFHWLTGIIFIAWQQMYSVFIFLYFSSMIVNPIATTLKT